MGWIPINNDVSISQAKYPRLVAYIKQNFQVNKVYWDVVGGVRLVNASGLYPRFTGNHWAGFTTNPDAAHYACGDKIDYASKHWRLTGTFYPMSTIWSNDWWNKFFSEGVFYNSWGDLPTGNQSASNVSSFKMFFDSDRQYNGNRSMNESRPKSIFFNLLVYAGYPVIM